ncbi:MAG TPA: ABC transporter ATP-binding protein [Gammaproteobacteria bacterium]|nr:ABC transporter ATP-binding protein [Gammaproteobacteria bacterium]
MNAPASSGDEKKLLLSARNVGLAFAYGLNYLRKARYWALRDVSFDLYEGETLGVIGHNGAGKSTLLRVLAGIYAPDAGQIMRHTKHRASLLALQVGFLPHISGRRNAVLSAMLLGLSRGEAEAVLPEIIEFSELGDFIDQPLRTYSAGMRARLGFAVALYANAELVLIDEVLGVGDKDFQKKSSAAIRAMMKSGKTAVVVSHSLETIRELCDRVLWIENGETRDIGPPARVLNKFLIYRTSPRHLHTLKDAQKESAGDAGAAPATRPVVIVCQPQCRKSIVNRVLEHADAVTNADFSISALRTDDEKKEFVKYLFTEASDDPTRPRALTIFPHELRSSPALAGYLRTFNPIVVGIYHADHAIAAIEYMLVNGMIKLSNVTDVTADQCKQALRSAEQGSKAVSDYAKDLSDMPIMLAVDKLLESNGTALLDIMTGRKIAVPKDDISQEFSFAWHAQVKSTLFS